MKFKFVNYLISIVLGLAIALIGGFLQATKTKLLITIPWGFGVYLILLIYTIIFIRNQFQSRLMMVSYFLSWLVITLLMSVKLRAGDLVLTNNLTAIIYLIGSVIVLSAAVVYPLKKTK